MEGREIRLRADALEVRKKDGDDGVGTLRGHAAVFEQETVIRMFSDGFREKIARGAFATALENGDDVRALINHDMDRVIGRRSSGTLRLKEDRTGLAVEIDLPDTQEGRDIKTLIDRGDIDGMSIGFRVSGEGQTWEQGKDGMMDLRTITEVAELIDVSPVTIPAYEGTDISSRGLPRAACEARSAARIDFEPPPEPVDPPEEESSQGLLERRQKEIALRLKRLEVDREYLGE